MLKHATPRSSPSLTSSSTEDPKQTSSVVGSPLSENQRTRLHVPGSKGSDSKNSCSGNSESKSSVSDGVETSQKGVGDSTVWRTRVLYNERGVDCEGIVSPTPGATKEKTGSSGLKLGEKILSLGNLSSAGSGIGPVITHGKAIVRRGLSFNTKREVDSDSVRSVKSEGRRGAEPNEFKAESLLTKASSVMGLQTKLPEKEEDGSSKNGGGNAGREDSNERNSAKDSKTSKQSNGSKSSNKKIFGISKHDHPSLKSLLRLPGVYGHIPVPENAPFGTPHILSPDSLSLNSSVSFISSNSGRTSSRSWSSNASSNSNNTSDSSLSNCSSTSEPTSTTLKIFAKCLRSDIEYKTVSVGSKVSSRQLINLLLSKARMKHRDPNLFYLTMEVTVRRWSGVPVRALLVLEESARPAQLALCRPSGDLKFVLQMRMGGIIKIHDTVLMPGSQYKSLLISYRTTSEEAVQLLLNCYGRKESKNYYALHEVCQCPNYKDRRLGPSEKPLEVKAEWPRDRKAEFVFVLRRNMTQALSLRKLSQRTDENRLTLREERVAPNAGGDKKRTGHQHKIPTTKDKREVGETVIDCTRTTPVMMTLIREDKEPVASSDVQKEAQNPVNVKWDARVPFNGKWEIQKSLNTKWEPPGVINGKLGTRNPMNEKWEGHEFLNRKREFENAVNGEREIRIPSSDTQCVGNASNVKNLTFGWEPRDDTRIPQKDLMFDISKPFSSYRKIEIKDTEDSSGNDGSTSDEISSSFSKRWQNSSYRITFHSLPNEQEYSKVRPPNSSSSKPEFPKSGSCLSSSRTTPNGYTPLEDFKHVKSVRFSAKDSVKDERLIKTSTSAVQTELTCIPLKGLKQRQKWNSVETLLESHYPRNRKEAFSRRTKMNGSDGDNIDCKTSVETSEVDNENDGKREYLETEHHPGKKCNCQKCFYI